MPPLRMAFVARCGFLLIILLEQGCHRAAFHTTFHFGHPPRKMNSSAMLPQGKGRLLYR